MDSKDALLLVVATIPNIIALTVFISTMRANQRSNAHATTKNTQAIDLLTEIAGTHSTQLAVLEDWRDGIDQDRRGRRKTDV
jgi:hypothetical protein